MELSTHSLTKNTSLLAHVYGALSNPEMKLNYSYVCQNGGHCLETKGIQRLSWSCQCPSGFSGINCESTSSTSEQKSVDFNLIVIATIIGIILIIICISCAIFLVVNNTRRKANRRLAQNREAINIRNGIYSDSNGMMYQLQPALTRMPLPLPSLSYNNSTIHFRHPHDSIYARQNGYSAYSTIPKFQNQDDVGYLEVGPPIKHYSMDDEYTDISSMLVKREDINLPPAPAPPMAEPNSQRSLPEIPPATPTKESPSKRAQEDEYLITTPLLSTEKPLSGEENNFKTP
ncbi:hypothetical protein Ciccas_003664 [Cichlidogyrus casuarinus]|uniref:EGF-like domain-containing protein n=1 Tax=Cichlidogyrus casuarinus TaxID=1844966 RepID=A0ABD2QE68_9PLAT